MTREEYNEKWQSGELETLFDKIKKDAYGKEYTSMRFPSRVFYEKFIVNMAWFDRQLGIAFLSDGNKDDIIHVDSLLDLIVNGYLIAKNKQDAYTLCRSTGNILGKSKNVIGMTLTAMQDGTVIKSFKIGNSYLSDELYRAKDNGNYVVLREDERYGEPASAFDWHIMQSTDFERLYADGSVEIHGLLYILKQDNMDIKKVLEDLKGMHLTVKFNGEPTKDFDIESAERTDSLGQPSSYGFHIRMRGSKVIDDHALSIGTIEQMLVEGKSQHGGLTYELRRKGE